MNIHISRLRVPNNAQRGTTLLELLIYISVLSFIVLAIASLFISLSKAKGLADALNVVNTNMRFVQNIITRDLKSATSVSTPLLPGTNATSLEMLVGADVITYEVVSAQLRRTVNANPPEIISTPNVLIESPLFVRLGNTNTILGITTTTIQFGMTVTFNSSSPDHNYTTRSTTTAALAE